MSSMCQNYELALGSLIQSTQNGCSVLGAMEDTKKCELRLSYAIVSCVLRVIVMTQCFKVWASELVLGV
jgi:hypothetical protein